MGSLRAAATFLVVSVVACSGRSPGGPPDVQPPPAATPKATPHLPGELFRGGQRLRVATFVGHDPARDLSVACRAAQDAAKARGEATDLCYAPEGMGTPSVVRIEHHPRLSGREVLRKVGPGKGSAHFVVEPNGSLYQILDLAHAAKREGVARPGEVRVLSAQSEGQVQLGHVLQDHFPGLPIEEVEATLEGSP